jgi:hypothetical protein
MQLPPKKDRKNNQFFNISRYRITSVTTEGFPLFYSVATEESLWYYEKK